jgi:hypothetical protein
MAVKKIRQLAVTKPVIEFGLKWNCVERFVLEEYPPVQNVKLINGLPALKEVYNPRCEVSLACLSLALLVCVFIYSRTLV